MTLMVFVLVAVGAAGLALAVRSRRRTVAVVGIAGLVATTVAAYLIEPGQFIVVAGTGLATTTYIRLFLLLGSIVALGLGLAGLAAGTRRDAPATAMAILAAGALTLGLRDPQAAVLVATAGGLFGTLVTLAPSGGLAAATVGIREARIVVVAGVLGIAATAWFSTGQSGLAAEPAVIGLAYLGFAVAVAMRFGAIPFHLWAARLADTVPETALPILTAVAPATLAMVALAWTETSVRATLVDLGPAQAIVLAIAIASILLGAVAAFVQDDIEHVLGYSIVGDAGVVILALGSLDAEVWAPARIWILVFVATRSAFAAWAAGVRTGFWTGSVPDLRGWARRSPILGGALITVAVASVGVPGLVGFDARATIVELALDGPLATLVLIGTLAPLAYYLRLLVVGLGDPGEVARSVDPGLPRIIPFDRANIRAWGRTTWRDNRAFSAAAIALLLAGLALGTSAGIFGASAAAAERPPALERAGPSASQAP
jgi:NADH-quinone oxidoreductase subunit N